MMVNHICKTTDYEYDSQVCGWLDKINLKLPNIHRITYLRDLSHDIVSSEPFVLLIKGNEFHGPLDRFYEDPRVLAIIKSYPAMKNTSTLKPPPDHDPKDSWDTVAYDWVFKEEIGRFVHPVLPEDDRTLNIPLGFCNGFLPTPNHDRDLSLFFNGQYSQNRYDVLKTLIDFKVFNKPAHATFYKGFGGDNEDRTGEGNQHLWDRATYASCMGNAIVGVCLAGFSPETYRIAEAALSGCFLLTNPLPDVDYYNAMPGITTPSVHMLEPYFKEFLAGAVLESWPHAAHESNIWYNEYIAPKAVAQKINQHLKEII
jgi:hypothetical protein